MQRNNCCTSFTDAEETVAKIAIKFLFSFVVTSEHSVSQSVKRDKSMKSTGDESRGRGARAALKSGTTNHNIVASLGELQYYIK
jgi:hypothetical protein